MRTSSLKKPLMLGENSKEGITRGIPIMKGSCIYCDEDVWGSDMAYTTQDPDRDQNISVVDVKPMHKLCLVELLAVGKEVMIAMENNLKQRGQL